LDSLRQNQGYAAGGPAQDFLIQLNSMRFLLSTRQSAQLQELLANRGYQADKGKRL
jgi:hypothetical protein